jgi:cysteine synthase B
VLDLSVIDARLLVSSYDAWLRTLQLKAQEGIFAGPSSGAVVEVALRVAATMDRGKIVAILADGGWKYMSEDHWMTKPPFPSSRVETEPVML